MGVVPLEPTLQPTLRLYGRLQKLGAGDKIHKKGREKSGSVSPPKTGRDNPGLSGYRGRPDLGRDILYRTRLETARTSPKPLTDKLYQVLISRTDKQIGLGKHTESP